MLSKYTFNLVKVKKTVLKMRNDLTETIKINDGILK